MENLPLGFSLIAIYTGIHRKALISELAIYARVRAYANSSPAATGSFRAEEAKKTEQPQGRSVFFGAPAENRTPDTLIKSQVLYQLSYRGI